MQFSKVSSALLLGFLLMIGLGLSVAHSHEGHEESECAFVVVQNAESNLAQENSIISPLIWHQTQHDIVVSVPAEQLIAGFFPRAPPASV